VILIPGKRVAAAAQDRPPFYWQIPNKTGGRGVKRGVVTRFPGLDVPLPNKKRLRNIKYQWKKIGNQ